MSNTSERELAGVFAALGDATRLALVTRLLAVGALTATALSEERLASVREAYIAPIKVESPTRVAPRTCP